MEPNEALGIAAQVAVTLAGFAGVVVVFRPEALHQWSALDKFRLQLFLGCGSQGADRDLEHSAGVLAEPGDGIGSSD